MTKKRIHHSIVVQPLSKVSTILWKKNLDRMILIMPSALKMLSNITKLQVLKKSECLDFFLSNSLSLPLSLFFLLLQNDEK